MTETRKATLFESLFSFAILVLAMSVGIIVYEVDPHIPMLFGAIAASLVALKIGYKWEAIREFMFHGIHQALQAIIILMIIGILVGVWIAGGVVPTMIYYGLDILSPQFFLVAAVLICSITSLATGTSWGTVGTIGIALIGIAQGLGIPAPIAAGAILSGAYFGDKMSPLSDTTNLAPAVSGTDLFTHIKFMALPSGIAYVLTLIFFAYMGTTLDIANTNSSSIIEMQNVLQDKFNINPILFIPPVIVIISIAFKFPAIPGIMLGIIAGSVLGGIMQNNITLGTLMDVGMNGFSIETGSEAIDKLLNKGGLNSMLFSVSLTILAMAFGGIMEKTGQLEAIVSFILQKVKSAVGLVLSTMATSITSNACMPEQYISIVIPGKMYAEKYKAQGLDPKTLSNAIEGSGTVTSVLIPWNTCGLYMAGVLGVSTYDYFQWSFFNYTMPLVVIALAFMGPSIAYAKKPQTT